MAEAKKTIRLLKPNEIECRVAAIKEHGLSLLLYKDARVDQKILDEVFGIYGWQRRHECIDGNLYCIVSVKNNETGEWVSKQDVGTSGMAEQEKSQASDSFKRACFNIGIGRELYSAPFIWVSAIHAPIRIDKRGDKFYCSNKFYVRKITYNGEREIESLLIVNEAGQEVFSWMLKNKYAVTDKNTENPAGKEPETENGADKENGVAAQGKIPDDDSRALSLEQMNRLKEELKRTGVTQKQVKDRYELKDIKVMSPLTYQKVMSALGVTESKAGRGKTAA
ncbi:MAG: hypothetical protein IJ661_00230 [Lachnospiraceae bacterium]|nr:hypothetical protein [Lachnospiraceae bacterium]